MKSTVCRLVQEQKKISWVQIRSTDLNPDLLDVAELKMLIELEQRPILIIQAKVTPDEMRRSHAYSETIESSSNELNRQNIPLNWFFLVDTVLIAQQYAVDRLTNFTKRRLINIPHSTAKYFFSISDMSAADISLLKEGNYKSKLLNAYDQGALAIVASMSAILKGVSKQENKAIIFILALAADLWREGTCNNIEGMLTGIGAGQKGWGGGDTNQQERPGWSALRWSACFLSFFAQELITRKTSESGIFWAFDPRRYAFGLLLGIRFKIEVDNYSHWTRSMEQFVFGAERIIRNARNCIEHADKVPEFSSVMIDAIALAAQKWAQQIEPLLIRFPQPTIISIWNNFVTNKNYLKEINADDVSFVVQFLYKALSQKVDISKKGNPCARLLKLLYYAHSEDAISGRLISESPRWLQPLLQQETGKWFLMAISNSSINL
jgi:hypothetical protein